MRNKLTKRTNPFPKRWVRLAVPDGLKCVTGLSVGITHEGDDVVYVLRFVTPTSKYYYGDNGTYAYRPTKAAMVASVIPYAPLIEAACDAMTTPRRDLRAMALSIFGYQKVLYALDEERVVLDVC